MAQQGVFEISVIGQVHGKLLDQALRRLREFAEHETDFTSHEDAFTRAPVEANGMLRDDDTVRVRAIKTKNCKTIWSLETMSKPLPAREISEVLIRGVSSVPIVEGHAGALAVALGYSDRRFEIRKRGQFFTANREHTRIYVYQLYDSDSATAKPFDADWHTIEVLSVSSLTSVQQSTIRPMQVLREVATKRTLEVKALLRGLVDLRRVEH